MPALARCRIETYQSYHCSRSQLQKNIACYRACDKLETNVKKHVTYQRLYCILYDISVKGHGSNHYGWSCSKACNESAGYASGLARSRVSSGSRRQMCDKEMAHQEALPQGARTIPRQGRRQAAAEPPSRGPDFRTAQ